MLYVGIDPGRSGAVAFHDPDAGKSWGELVDTLDATAVADALCATAGAKIRVVAVEVPVGRPPQHGGWKQLATQWRAVGVAEGVVMALGLPILRVSPKEWHRLLSKGPKGESYADRKRRSLVEARQRFPGARLDRVKDGALADALWIALAGREAA